MRDNIISKLDELESAELTLQYELLALFELPMSPLTPFTTVTLTTSSLSLKAIKTSLNDLIIEYLELQKESPNPQGIPRWPIIFFLIGVTFCLAASATFHLFYSMSPGIIIDILDAFKYFRRLDYAGVIINVIGTGVPPIYYTLYCHIQLATIYLSTMTLFGSILFITLMGDWIQSPAN